MLDPAESFLARSNGKDTWYGWLDDPLFKRLRLSWFVTQDPAEQRGIADGMQRDVLSFAPYLPLGQILQPTAWRDTLTGVLPGFAKFWPVRKA